jgi:hypothetical protein
METEEVFNRLCLDRLLPDRFFPMNSKTYDLSHCARFYLNPLTLSI